MSQSENYILYLSEADISGLTLDMGDIMAGLEQAFRLSAAGKILGVPKSSIWIGPGEGFQSLSVVDTERETGVLKWIGLVPPGRSATANVNASILLSDTRSGEISCFMDARRATALRTAGMSALAAKYLARDDSRSVGFIGTGVQALSHLHAFAGILPSLRTVRAYSAKPSGTERFVEQALQMGLDASAVTADEAIGESDVIVTTVPLASDFQPFLDAARTTAGAFIAAIDLGRPWLDPSLAAMDLTMIDDEAMRHASKPGSFIPPLGQADATLCDLVTGRHSGRTTPDQRIIYVSSGSALADLAIGRLIYQQALAANIGQRLAR